MTEPKGHPCPECGAPRDPDHTPTCACTQRAADALRDARTAQAAAAEDFNPLRIRPYVELNGPAAHPTAGEMPAHATADEIPPHAIAGEMPPHATAGEMPTRELPAIGPRQPAPPAVETTMLLRAVTPGAGSAQEATATATGVPDAAPVAPGTRVAGPEAPAAGQGWATAPGLPAVPGASVTSPDTVAVAPEAPGAQAPSGTAATDRTSVLPTPLAPPADAPSDTDLLLFEVTETAELTTSGGDGETDWTDGNSGASRAGVTDTARRAGGAREDSRHTHRRRHRRRRGLILGATGGVVAVVAAAGYTSGLFSYESPTRDSALPTDLRASVPDVAADASSEAPGSASPSASRTSASPSPSADDSTSPSPSASRSSASPRPSKKRAEPPAPTPTVTANGNLSSDPDNSRGGGPVLRRGDRGPEVAELQTRLRELGLYGGEANGNFNSQVENALSDYQRSRGVETGEGELGVYGQATRRSLESETQEP